MNEQANKQVIIIGAGPSGLFAARTLQKYGVKKITILEKEDRVGGMCHSYLENNLCAEYGATVVFPTAKHIFKAAKEKGIIFGKPLTTDKKSISMYDKIMRLSLLRKIIFISGFLVQLVKFFKCVYHYQQARDNLRPLPVDYALSFAEFSRKYGMVDICSSLEPYITGCGYGTLEECEASSIFEAMGYATMINISLFQYITIKNVLYQVKGGLQSLMEKIAEDFDVKKSVNIIQVIRSEKHVQVQYQQNNQHYSIEADVLVMAISPLHWKKIGLALTPIEEKFVANLVYYHYPVAICKIKNIVAESGFFAHTLANGYLSCMQTQDPRIDPEDGRLCTVYISMPLGNRNFTFEPSSPHITSLTQTLKERFSAQEITFLDNIVWEGYMPTIDWTEKCALEKEQFANNTKTIYLGAYTLGCFETLSHVTDKAAKTIERVLARW